MLYFSNSRGLLASVNFSFVVKLRPDATVLAITLLFCLIATMLFSLGPALKATKADLVNDLKAASRRTGAHRSFQPFLRATSHFGHGANRAFAHVAFRRRIIFPWCAQGGWA